MSNLKKLRQKLDKTDEKLLKILAERFKITHEVGLFKKENKLKPCDKQREIELLEKKKIMAEKLNLNPSFIIKLFKMIISEVKKEHRKIKNEK